MRRRHTHQRAVPNEPVGRQKEFYLAVDHNYVRRDFGAFKELLDNYRTGDRVLFRDSNRVIDFWPPPGSR